MFITIIAILLLVAGARTFIDVLEYRSITEEKLVHGLFFLGSGTLLLVARHLKKRKEKPTNTDIN